MTTSPDQARALLNGQPQLTYAIFQSMLMMGVVDASVLGRMLSTGGGGPPPAPVQAAPPPQPNYGPPPGAYGAPPPMRAAPPPAAAYGHPGPNPSGYGTPPHQMGMPPPRGAPAVDPAQQQLIDQVMALTEQQIAMLPPDQKQTILQIVRTLCQMFHLRADAFFSTETIDGRVLMRHGVVLASCDDAWHSYLDSREAAGRVLPLSGTAHRPIRQTHSCDASDEACDPNSRLDQANVWFGQCRALRSFDVRTGSSQPTPGRQDV